MSVRIFRADHTASAAMRSLAMELRASLKMLDGERSARDDALYVHEVEGWLLDPSTAVLMAVLDGVPSGYIVFQKGQLSGKWDPDILVIRGFYCQPLAKARGVPGLLYRAAYRYGLWVKASKVQVMVRWGHDEIATLACDHGFKPVAAVLEMELKHERRQPDLRTGAVESVHAAGVRGGSGGEERVPELAVLPGNPPDRAEPDREP